MKKKTVKTLVSAGGDRTYAIHVDAPMIEAWKIAWAKLNKDKHEHEHEAREPENKNDTVKMIHIDYDQTKATRR